MRKLLIPVFAAATLAGLSAPATAGEVTIRINLADLDLAKPADVDAVKERINTQVAKACNRSAISLPYDSNAVQECIADGTAKALKQLDAKRSLALAMAN